MKLIVGLGNVGSQYIHTRHNIGFAMLDCYRTAHQAQFKAGIVKTVKRELRVWYSDSVVLLKPPDQMNNSGKAVEAVTIALDIPNDDVLVLHDDVDFDLGRLKVKCLTNNGRHRGVSDIAMRLGTSFGRVKIGIDKPPHYQTLAEYVLSDFGPVERDCMCGISHRVCNVIDTFIEQGIEATMTRYNRSSNEQT